MKCKGKEYAVMFKAKTQNGGEYFVVCGDDCVITMDRDGNLDFRGPFYLIPTDSKEIEEVETA